MKLEPGKEYRTRDGRVVKVRAEWETAQGMFHCDDEVSRRADGTARDWDGGRVPKADIVAEWPDDLKSVEALEAAAYQRGYEAGLAAAYREKRT
jgi:hypothetical protein